MPEYMNIDRTDKDLTVLKHNAHASKEKHEYAP